MAYHLTYYGEFNNRITERIKVSIYRKDIEPDSVETIKIAFCNKKFINGNGDKFDTIISSELNLGIFVSINSNIEFDDILVSFTDEWKIIVTNDEQIDFIGWLVPNECQAAFRDKPYDIELTATDGLGYLRDVFLTDINDDNFSGTNFLIDYVAGCLKKTLLDLNIRIYCNIYEGSFPDRNTDTTSDMFNKAKLDYRTFLVDPIDFIKCFATLETILKEGFSLFQWFGKWVIMRIGELQYSNGPLIWYTEYDSDGTVLSAQLEEFKAAQVAKQQILHPVNANQIILSRLAIKSAKTRYNYNIWPEIPLNNKFERGTEFETGPLPDGRSYKKFTIDDWIYGVTLPGSPSTFPPNVQATTDLAYRYTEYNIYGVEQTREVRLERTGGVAGHRLLMCDPIPVNYLDRVNVSVDFKTSQAGTGTRQYLMIMLLPYAGGNGYRLNNQGAGAPSDGVGTLVWEATGSLKFLAKFYDSGEDAANYYNFNLDLPPFPEAGLLYVIFINFDPPTGRTTFYKNFSIQYYPQLAGETVVADYWLTEQDINYRDISEKEIEISDSPLKVLKGALLQSDGVTLTERSWHRLDIAENRDYKELINIARYNAAYRRTWQISGSFGGTMFHPSNDQTIRQPLGFHKQFFFPNSDRINGYFFQLVPPLTIDYVDGSIDATFVDCMKLDENNESIDGSQLGDTHEFKYIFKNG